MPAAVRCGISVPIQPPRQCGYRARMLKKMVDGPKDEGSADKEQRHAEGNIAPVIGPPAAVIPQPPPTATENEDPCNKGRRTDDPAMFYVTLAGVIAVIAYTSVAAWQACLTNQQLVVMQNEQRPWLAIEDVKPAGDYSVNKGIAWINSIEFHLKNVRHGPATNVRIDPIIYPKDSRHAMDSSDLDTQKTACAGKVGGGLFDPTQYGKTIFPKSTWVQSPGTNIQPITNWPFDFIVPIITGCVSYQFTPTGEEHKTGFMIGVTTTRKGGIKMNEGNVIPKDELRFDSEPLGDFAN